MLPSCFCLKSSAAGPSTDRAFRRSIRARCISICAIFSSRSSWSSARASWKHWYGSCSKGMLRDPCKAARRRREPMGLTPVRRSWRSCDRVMTRLGSRGGGGTSVGEVVVARSACRAAGVVLKARKALTSNLRYGADLAHWQRSPRPRPLNGAIAVRITAQAKLRSLEMQIQYSIRLARCGPVPRFELFSPPSITKSKWMDGMEHSYLQHSHL